MDKIKVSVIIPTFNRAECIDRAIKSVLNQSEENIELIIIDDGSDDRTSEIVTENSDHRVTYFHTENKGVSYARNLGVKLAKADWISFLDSDDEWLPEKLEKQLEFLDKNPEYKIVHGEEIWFRNGRRVNPKIKHQKFGGWIFDKCVPLCAISPSTVLLEKKLYNELNGFNEDFPVCEDYDLWLKITSLMPVGFISEPIIVKYGGHEDQLSKKHKAMDYYRVKSLNWILQNRDLKNEWHQLAVDTLLNKSDILISGYEKHQRPVEKAEIESIRSQY